MGPLTARSTSNDQKQSIFPVNQNATSSDVSTTSASASVSNAQQECNSHLGNDIVNCVSSILSEKFGNNVVPDDVKTAVKNEGEEDSVDVTIGNDQRSTIKKIVEETLKAVVPVKASTLQASQDLQSTPIQSVRLYMYIFIYFLKYMEISYE